MYMSKERRNIKDMKIVQPESFYICFIIPDKGMY